MNPEAMHPSDPRRNQLLAALAEDDWARWEGWLEPVLLTPGQVLCESGAAASHVVFPTTAIVSLIHMTQDGGSCELAVVGHDGVVGFSLFMGGSATPSRAVVQSAGWGYRLRADTLKGEVDRAGEALRVLLRYTQALIAQVAQTALCNRYHSIDQQFSRRLLLGLDRSSGNVLAMTQEGVAHLLGVRREGVTAAALKLQQAGVIRYSRGRIDVLDRQGLAQRACECYAVAGKEYERLLPAQVSAPSPQRFTVVHAAERGHAHAVIPSMDVAEVAFGMLVARGATPPRGDVRSSSASAPARPQQNSARTVFAHRPPAPTHRSRLAPPGSG